jgi:transketolase
MTTLLSSRAAYGRALADLGEKNTQIVVLDADLAKATYTIKFAEKFPERFFDMGIAEQDMMSTAAGIATFGLIPFASTFAIFSMRAVEQIRNMIAYPKLNVKIVATHAGVEIGEDGGSHQAIEDIAIMRAIPNMTVIAPADHVATVKAVRAIAEYNGPVYMRLGRADHQAVYGDDFNFEIGKSIQLRSGKDLTIIAIGNMVEKSLAAADELGQSGYSIRVIDMHTIKPLDEVAVIRAAQDTKGIISVEDHSVIGGLGSAIAETITLHHPTSLIRVGLNDCFGQSGNGKELLEHYGLSVSNIVQQALKILQ